LIQVVLQVVAISILINGYLVLRIQLQEDMVGVSLLYSVLHLQGVQRPHPEVRVVLEGLQVTLQSVHSIKHLAAGPKGVVILHELAIRPVSAAVG